MDTMRKLELYEGLVSYLIDYFDSDSTMLIRALVDSGFTKDEVMYELDWLDWDDYDWWGEIT